MTFLFPLGFLALLGIPVLILIYIIKNRYTEQTVTSTYLWTLSEKFLRRRIPINRLTGILSLILQILAVILIAVIVAHPVITLPGAAQAYCFVLDASGSMNIEYQGSTRFEEGRQKIKDMINGSVKGSTYTLICAGATTETVFEGYTDKERAVEAVDELESGYTAAGLGDALIEAQKYFNDNPRAHTYLITDKVYADSQNVDIINVGGGAVNYALRDAAYEYTADGGLKVSGKAVSYGGDAEVEIGLYFNGSDEEYSVLSLQLSEGEEKAFEFGTGPSDFESFELRINDGDDLGLDSSVTVFNKSRENSSDTLLVSDGSIYMEAALRSVGVTNLTVIKAEEYEGQTGYGLYIFENFVPEITPAEGSVWYINPDKSPEGANFSFQTEVEANGAAVYSTSTKTTVRKMLDGVTADSFLLKRFVKLGTGGGDFTVYATCDGSPLMFSGANAYGNREVVMAFSLRDSAAFTLSLDCTTLISNFINYSFPEVVDSTAYVCGDILPVNVLPGCKNIRIVAPSGKESYPDISTTVSEYLVSEVGAYKIYLTMADGSEREVNVYSTLPEEESVPLCEEEAFKLTGTPQAGGLAGFYDDLLAVFIILAVLVAADFGVYCYEQYQLR